MITTSDIKKGLCIKYSNDILNLNNKYNFQLNNQLDTGVGVTPLLGDAL